MNEPVILSSLHTKQPATLCTGQTVCRALTVMHSRQDKLPKPAEQTMHLSDSETTQDVAG